MSEINDVIHQSTRLRIIAALVAIPGNKMLEFTALKSLLEATDGNLGSHISTLENAGYVSVKKDFNGKKPRTRISLTSKGRKAFRSHVSFLREIIDVES